MALISLAGEGLVLQGAAHALLAALPPGKDLWTEPASLSRKKVSSETVGRIAETFARLREQRRVGLFPYLTAGYPTLEATLELVPALVRGGADLVELGIPFSDPLADGATIQHANLQALASGVTPKECLAVVQRLRSVTGEMPLVLMGYYNPILAWGVEAFCQACAQAGVDGLIVTDLPPEEAKPLLSACHSCGLDLVFLLAPTSTEERIRRVCQQASGFIYCVSLAGVTGAREQIAGDLPEFLSRVRQHTALPLAVGFGISSRDHVVAVGSLAEAAVVGSALINLLDHTPEQERALKAQEFVALMAGRRPETGA